MDATTASAEEPPRCGSRADRGAHEQNDLPMRTDSASGSESDGEGDGVRESDEVEDPKLTAARKRSSNDGDKKPPARRRRVRVRKPTYLVQKHERERLEEEIKLLESQLELMRMKAGLPTTRDKRSLASLQARNYDMEESIHANLLWLGRAQSMLTNEIQSTPKIPMRSFIHLPRHPAHRRAVLEDMKEMKLRRAQEVALNRLHAIDPTRPYVNEERFLTDDGIYHCKRYEVEQFEGLSCARQVYEAILFFLSNVEITVTETLGNLTIREDAADIDPTIWNHRLISKTTAGYTEELNIVGFTRFYDHYEPHNGAQFGVITADSVDIDELHPYVPEERLRRDVTSVHIISEFRKPETQELVVIHSSCVFLAAHPPQFEMPPGATETMRETMASWSSAMARSVRDSVYGHRSRETPS